MQTKEWTGSGPDYSIGVGGMEWRLRLAEKTPGLTSESIGLILGLEGIAAPGRRDRSAFGPATLREFSCRFQHVEAIYQPLDWDQLVIRTTWSPTADGEGTDLLIELSARSVGDLRAVEVYARSQLGSGPIREDGLGPRSIRTRNAGSAALTYDGRESDLEGLLTRPPSDLIEEGASYTLLGNAEITGNRTLIVLAHPDDISRSMVADDKSWVRHALFGYDLERGVVLRGRLRVLLTADPDPRSVAISALRQFLAEPLPLTT